MVIIQNYWLSAPYGRNWTYLWSSKHAPKWAIVLLVILFFGVIWAGFMVLFGQLSKADSWIIPLFAIGLGAPRWCQMLWVSTNLPSLRETLINSTPGNLQHRPLRALGWLRRLGRVNWTLSLALAWCARRHSGRGLRHDFTPNPHPPARHFCTHRGSSHRLPSHHRGPSFRTRCHGAWHRLPRLFQRI